MSVSQLLISQAPVWQEYIEATRVQWASSRHPENVQETLEVARQTTEGLDRRDKVVLYGSLALTAAQQSFLNEMAVGLGVGAVLAATDGNIPAAIATTAVITGSAELASSAGIAHSLDKQRPAIDIVSDRYIDKEKITEKAQQRAEKGKKPSRELGRIYLAASVVLASGATIYEDLRDRTRTLRDNMRTAKIASAMVVGNYCATTAIVTGAAKGLDKAGVEGSMDALVNVTRNPILMASVVGGLFGILKIKERRETAKRLKSRDGNANTDTNSAGTAGSELITTRGEV